MNIITWMKNLPGSNRKKVAQYYQVRISRLGAIHKPSVLYYDDVPGWNEFAIWGNEFFLAVNAPGRHIEKYRITRVSYTGESITLLFESLFRDKVTGLIEQTYVDQDRVVTPAGTGIGKIGIVTTSGCFRIDLDIPKAVKK